MKKHVLAVLVGASLILTACGDGDENSSNFVSNPDNPPNDFQDPVVSTGAYAFKIDDPADEEMAQMLAQLDGIFAQVSSEKKLMTYKMLGMNGKETLATAVVYRPAGVGPEGGWPIVAWAHGTTGVADQCAPSRQQISGNEFFIAQLLAAGYAVVAPDYEGLGEPSGREPHPFLNVKSEAYSITDAVVAANQYLNGKIIKARWAVVGHSQGGQAALGAAQYASRANLNYKGAIAVAPASNLGLILAGGEQKAEAEDDLGEKIRILASLDTFSSLITAGLKNPYPVLQYSQVFKSPTDQIAAKAETDCYDVLGKTLGGAMMKHAQANGNLNSYPRTQPNFMTAVPEINAFLTKDSQPLQVKITTPIFIYQGSADPTVPKQATDFLVMSAEGRGTKISYETDKDLPDDEKWDHNTAYTENWKNIINDVKALMPIQ